MASVPPMLLIGVGVLCLGNLLHIIGLGTTHWMDTEVKALGRTYEGSWGLFKVCGKDSCAEYKNESDSLRATQAMTIMGMLAALVAGAVALIFVLFKLLSKNCPKIFTMLCAAAGCGAFLLIIIGVIIFGADVYDSDVGDLGYSFGLSIVGAILIAVGGILVMVGGKSVE